MILKLKIIKDINNLTKSILGIKEKNQFIGFVPTMGCLHNGHLSLLNQSISENDITICSIYVNPTQFNDKNDFLTYPRHYNLDIDLLKSIDCDLLFLPRDQEMYPNNDADIKYYNSNYMDILEGEKRPGHFSGVITIVNKLFNLIQPDRAYFGEKDYQQLWIIQSFTQNCQLPIEIKSCPTIREENGLALSSRNVHLTAAAKEQAGTLFSTLELFKNEVKYRGILNEVDFAALKQKLINSLLSNSLIKLDYFEVIEEEYFRFAREIKNNTKYRIVIAAYVGRVRLIDNMSIE
ncbi:MAG: pantoate--beta-alanine ligase [Flavobacteriales bacterium]|nr:pantoate--beta-alanine ligase [Flavobacteriales bacterium]